jgi:DnaJ-class molecular chaperone
VRRPTLEEPCQKCEGSGLFTECRRQRRCDWCQGAGFIPTEFGERVLDLMRHNFRPMLQDATNDKAPT